MGPPEASEAANALTDTDHDAQESGEATPSSPSTDNESENENERVLERTST
jgi:hypothetical protein